MPINKNKEIRLNILDGLLKKAKGYTIEELTHNINQILQNNDKQEVTSRTIYNDLKDIDIIYGIEVKKINSRYKYADPNDSIRKSRAKPEEKNTIELGLNLVSQTLKHYTVFEKFSDIINRLLASDIYNKIQGEETARIIQIGESENESGNQYLETIYLAITEKKAIKVYYRKASGEKNWRIISPYLLKEYRNQWYMVGYSADSSRGGSSSVYSLSRIESVFDLGTESYVLDDNFNVNDYFKYSLGIFHDLYNAPIIIRLKFKGELFRNLFKEYKLHSSMKVESSNAKETIISMEVYHTIELESLILGYGAKVEVLEPIELRNRIFETIVEMAKVYEK